MRIERLKVRGYSHKLNERGDFIINVSPAEAIQRRRKCNFIQILEMGRKEKDLSFQGFFSNIQNDLARMMSKVLHYNDIIALEKKRTKDGKVEEKLEERLSTLR